MGATKVRTHQNAALASLLCLYLAGCSILSPSPAWELVKATGGLATMAIQSAPGEASNTIIHAYAPFKELCIEYNPQTQVADIVQVLQTALRNNNIESRLYEGPMPADKCGVWLKYSAYIDWEIPPMGDRYRSYVFSAALTLKSDKGLVLATSSYLLDSSMGLSKWASTGDKLTPVVNALLASTQKPVSPTTPMEAPRL